MLVYVHAYTETYAEANTGTYTDTYGPGKNKATHPI
jgi:hypothetical protein